MPILPDIAVRLTLDEVVRAQGIRDYARLKPVMKTAIDEMMALGAADGILERPSPAKSTRSPGLPTAIWRWP